MAFANPQDLASHHLPYSSAAGVSTEELAGLGQIATMRAREGTLYQAAGDPGIYIIDYVEGSNPPQWRKRNIEYNAWVKYFTDCRYTSQTHVTQVSSDFYAANYPVTGPLVTASGPRPDGQVVFSGNPYVIESGVKRQFSSLNAYYSYNFPYPSCTTYLPPTGTQLRAREGTRVRPSGGTAQYLIERVGNSFYKRFLTANALTYYNINGTLRVWPLSEVNSYPDINDAKAVAAHVHPVKSLHADKWAWSVSASNPLKFDRNEDAEQGFTCPGCLQWWNAGISNGINAWINQNTTIKYLEWPYNGNNHIHVIVTDRPLIPFGGWTQLFENGVDCGDDLDCPGATYHQAVIYLNDPEVLGNDAARTSMMSHELGHGNSISHPNSALFGDLHNNGICGGVQQPDSIMDYDCMANRSGPHATPPPWDTCGVNHRYVSGSGYAGC